MSEEHVERRREYKNLDEVNRDISDIKADLCDLKNEISTLRMEIHGLLVAWNTANGMVSFLKWLAASALMTFALWDYIRAFFRI